jgi:hypothetical protein
MHTTNADSFRIILNTYYVRYRSNKNDHIIIRKKEKKKPRAQHHNRSMHPSERSMDVNRSMPPATGACTTRHVQEKK